MIKDACKWKDKKEASNKTNTNKMKKISKKVNKKKSKGNTEDTNILNNEMEV